MRKLTTLTLTAILALVALSGFSGVGKAAPKITVKLGDDFFKPAQKTVERGTKIRFKWVGSSPHNVTQTRGPGRHFMSRTTSRRGINFAKRFVNAGTYRLICTVHPDTMRLKLTVR